MSTEPNISRILRLEIENGQLQELTEVIKGENNGHKYTHNYIFQLADESEKTGNPIDKLKYNVIINRFLDSDDDKNLSNFMKSEKITSDKLHEKIKNLLSSEESNIEKIVISTGNKSFFIENGNQEFDKLKYTIFSRLNFSLEDVFDKYKKVIVNFSNNKESTEIDSYYIITKKDAEIHSCDKYEKGEDGSYRHIQHASDRNGKILEGYSSTSINIKASDFYSNIQNQLSDKNINSINEIKLFDKTIGNQTYFKKDFDSLTSDLLKIINKSRIKDLNKPNKSLASIAKAKLKSNKNGDYLIINYNEKNPEKIGNIKYIQLLPIDPLNNQNYACFDYRAEEGSINTYRYLCNAKGENITETEDKLPHGKYENYQQILDFINEENDISHIKHNSSKAPKTELLHLLAAVKDKKNIILLN